MNEMGTGYDQSSVESWLVQPIKELSSAEGRHAVRAVHILGTILYTEILVGACKLHHPAMYTMQHAWRQTVQITL